MQAMGWASSQEERRGDAPAPGVAAPLLAQQQSIDEQPDDATFILR